MDAETSQQLLATAERLASAAETLDRVLEKLDSQQAALNAKVDRIAAAVEERTADAFEAAEQLKSLHPTAHVPTPKELDKNLFDNRNTGYLKGTFNTSGEYPGSVYRTCASYNGLARVQYFDDGGQYNYFRGLRHPVRLVW